MFIIDYKYGEEPVRTKLFNWESEWMDAEQFCAEVRANGGAVNIRIRHVEIPN